MRGLTFIGGVCVAGVYGMQTVSALGGKGGLLGGKKGGARYTTVVSRPAPVPQPLFAQAMERAYVADTLPELGVDPFFGERAAISGKIIGVAPLVRSPIEPQTDGITTFYRPSGSALGDSLGLGPIPYSSYGSGPLGLARGGYRGSSGFPMFEADGYIVHDQRGRDSSECPPGGCPAPGTMSAEAKAMYDKYKRYYRDYGGAGRSAPPPAGRLIEPVPIQAYDRLGVTAIGEGTHFTASPVLDRRSRLVAGMPGMTTSPILGERVDTDRVALGGLKGRDSFFGRIYDAQDTPLASRVASPTVNVESDRLSSGGFGGYGGHGAYRPYGMQAYAQQPPSSLATLGQQEQILAGSPTSFDAMPVYKGGPTGPAALKATTLNSDGALGGPQSIGERIANLTQGIGNGALQDTVASLGDFDGDLLGHVGQVVDLPDLPNIGDGPLL